MTFTEMRIINDIETLAYSISIKLCAMEASFSLKFDSKIYTRIYNFTIKFPDSYPFKSPKVYVKEHIFHPNIYNNNICLKVLRENWMPAYDINSIITSLILVFEEPSHEDPYNNDAALLIKYNYKGFLEMVKEVDNMNNK